MLAPLALLTLGCASVPERSVGQLVAGEAFELSITPIYVAGQADMIEEATEIEVILRDLEGNETTFAMYEGDDQTYENTEIWSLEDSEVFLVGRNANGVVFHGRSEPLTLSTGTASVYIFIARDGASLSLPNLDMPSAMGPLHALGNGQFLTIGGTRDGSRGQDLASDITLFDMRTLGLGTSTQTLTDSIHATSSSGWTSHTSTLLENGNLVIVGGAQGLTNSAGSLTGQSTATALVSVLDPDAATVTAATPMNHGRFAHQATLGPSGRVVVTGGFAARSSEMAVVNFAEIYDPDEDTWTVVDGTLYTGGVFHAQSRFGDTGVLVCGGLDTAFTPSSECQLILPDARVQSSADLSRPLLHAQLTDIGQGRALLTGGLVAASTDTVLPLTSNLTATSEAWILDDSGWRPVGSMSIARALHSAHRTSDGRVVVAGGVARIDASSDRSGQPYSGLLFDAADALPCVEIFDPDTESFTALSACGASSETGTLPAPVALPAVAHDPVFGTLVHGGLTPDPRESSPQRTLLYPRFADRDQVE